MGNNSLYETPYQLYPQLQDLMLAIHKEKSEPLCVMVLGEVFGAGVQDLNYGSAEPCFRMFDVRILPTEAADPFQPPHIYLPAQEVAELANRFSIPMVPTLYEGPYDFNTLLEVSTGPTIVGESAHMREGVVIRPVVEGVDPKIGRRILKLVSGEYLSRKGGSENH